MKQCWLALAAVLVLSGVSPAMADTVQFGCEARSGSVCYFRLFLQPRGGRVIVLPAGMKEKVPELQVGKDSYCVVVGKTPLNNCARKLVGASYNS